MFFKFYELRFVGEIWVDSIVWWNFKYFENFVDSFSCQTSNKMHDLILN